MEISYILGKLYIRKLDRGILYPLGIVFANQAHIYIYIYRINWISYVENVTFLLTFEINELFELNNVPFPRCIARIKALIKQARIVIFFSFAPIFPPLLVL